MSSTSVPRPVRRRASSTRFTRLPAYRAAPAVLSLATVDCRSGELGGPATIDGDDGPADERRAVGGKKGRHLSDLVRLARPLQRGLLEHLREVLGASCAHDLGEDEARTDRGCT